MSWVLELENVRASIYELIERIARVEMAIIESRVESARRSLGQRVRFAGQQGR